VCRERGSLPEDGGCPASDGAERDDECGLWLGAIQRGEYEAARAAAGQCAGGGEAQVVVSPFGDGARVRHRGWLSPHVRWVRFRDLTRAWCEEHLL
jgi:hypothetical protein